MMKDDSKGESSLVCKLTSSCSSSQPVQLSNSISLPRFQFKTQYGKRVVLVTVTVNDTVFNLTNSTQEISREEVIPIPGTVNGVNALGLVVFSMCFGLIIGNMKEQGQPLRDFFDCLNEAIMRLVAIIMWSVACG